ncbi:MAG: ATP-binding protein, partial [Melioribacteraceae bacterium]|nr:ATP-binding protein [Melioribacteraceae bacterium]
NYNLATGNIENYGTEDGIIIPSAGYPNNPHFLGKDGEIYVGGTDGYIIFHPDSLRKNLNPPPIVLTDLKVKNKSVEISDSSYLNKSIHDIEVLELPYNENMFSIGFAALDYTAPNKNKYAFKLEGFNDDWVYTDAENRLASYTNLDPGDYLFKVKGSNSDGIWNETGASLKIIILPPWYRTWLAYFLYSVLALSIVAFLYNQQRRRLGLKHEIELKEFEAKKRKEIDEMKSKFFANISHEFRTPLTLINNPVKELMDKIKPERTYVDGRKIRKELDVVRKYSNRLLNLVNQLLDLSKYDLGKMRLKASQQNIVSLLKELTLSFSSYAQRKNITQRFISEENIIMVYIDTDKFEKIITNILSNAFKFTPEEGRIDVVLTRGNNNSNLSDQKDNVGEYVNIKITDSGVGIPEDHIPKIFDRFYQVDGSHIRDQNGTGIGLSLAKELVELHKGKIEVYSEIGKGTSFTISLLLGKEHLKPEEIFESADDKEDQSSISSKIASQEEVEIINSEFDFLSENGN